MVVDSGESKEIVKNRAEEMRGKREGLDGEKLPPQKSRPQLRIFLGMASGVGKTRSMLISAHQRMKEGDSVLIGPINTHGCSRLVDLLKEMEIPLVSGPTERRALGIVGSESGSEPGSGVGEMDIDAILSRRPQLLVVDDLAHINPPGSRHSKRYQDVLEILEAGISVYTTINVQNFESRKDAAEKILGSYIVETVPDSLLENENWITQVELVDLIPSEFLKRFLTSPSSSPFTEDQLMALRELALRMTAEQVDHELQKFSLLVGRDDHPWHTNERLLVAISHSSYSERLIRATRRMAYNLEAPWLAVYVDTGISLNDREQAQLVKNLNLARELNAEVITTTGIDVPSILLRISCQKNVTQIVVGHPPDRRSLGLFRSVKQFVEGGSLLTHLVREGRNVDIHIVRQELMRQEFLEKGAHQEILSSEMIAERFPSVSVPGGGVTDVGTLSSPGSVRGSTPDEGVGSSSLGGDDSLPPLLPSSSQTSPSPSSSLSESETSSNSSSPFPRVQIIKYWYAIWFVVGVATLGAALEPLIGYRAVGYVFMMGILFLGLMGSVGAMTFSSLLSAIVWDFFFVPPRFSFWVDQWEDVWVGVSFFAVSMIASFLTRRVRFGEKILVEREERTQVLYEVLNDIVSSQDKAEFLTKVVNRVGGLFRADCGVILRSPGGDLNFSEKKTYNLWIDREEEALVDWAYTHLKDAGWSTENMPQAQILCLPLMGATEAVGVFILRPKNSGRKLDLDQEGLIHSIMGQLGSSIERHFLLKRLLASARSEIDEGSRSHQRGDLPFLSLTSFSHNLCDIVTSSVETMGSLLKDHNLEIEISPDLGEVSCNFQLLAQVFSRILFLARNAAPPKSSIRILAESLDSRMRIGIETEADLETDGEGREDKWGEKRWDERASMEEALIDYVISLHGGTFRKEKVDPQGWRWEILLPQTRTKESDGENGK